MKKRGVGHLLPIVVLMLSKRYIYISICTKHETALRLYSRFLHCCIPIIPSAYVPDNLKSRDQNGSWRWFINVALVVQICTLRLFETMCHAFNFGTVNSPRTRLINLQ